MAYKKILTLLALGGALSAPVLAQTDTSPQTNLDPVAAEKERRAATVPRELTPVTSEQGHTNAMQRCANLPAAYKVDCESRVNGQGNVSGSVIGGGMLKETETQIQIPPQSPASAP